MEFDFIFKRESGVDDDGYLLFEGGKLPNKLKASKNIVRVIDDMGQASSKVTIQIKYCGIIINLGPGVKINNNNI